MKKFLLLDSLRLSFFFWRLRHYPVRESAWSQLEREGWYWYVSRAEGRRGYVLSNGNEWTDPLECETLEDFFRARERFAENEIKQRDVV